MIVEQKLKDIQTRAAEIEKQMNSGDVSGAELTRNYPRNIRGYLMFCH